MKKLGIVCLWTYLVTSIVGIGIWIWSIISPKTYVKVFNTWMKRIIGAMVI